MKGKELIDMFNKGIRPVVKFTEDVSDLYSQFEKNMLATVVDIREDVETADIYEVVLDESAFKKHNISLETASCLNEETGKYDLTWSEFQGRTNSEIFYIEEDKDICNFEVVEDAYSELVREFLDSGTDLNYLDWLQEKVFELRALLDL